MAFVSNLQTLCVVHYESIVSYFLPIFCFFITKVFQHVIRQFHTFSALFITKAMHNRLNEGSIETS